MPDCFAAWFMSDEPFPHPVLLYALTIGDKDKALEAAKMAYEQATKIAEAHGIHRTIYAGIYADFILLMDNCVFAARNNK